MTTKTDRTRTRLVPLKVQPIKKDWCDYCIGSQPEGTDFLILPQSEFGTGPEQVLRVNFFPHGVFTLCEAHREYIEREAAFDGI